MAGPLDILVPSVNPSGAPDDYERIPSSPEAFGGFGAEAEKSLGRGAMGVSEAAFSYLNEQNSLNNQIHASEVHSDYSDKAGDIVSGFTELQGRAAMDALPDAKQKIIQLQKDAENAAGNLQTKAMIAANTRRTQDYLIGMMTKHADSQQTIWATKTAQDNVTSAVNMGSLAIRNAYDLNKLDQQMAVVGAEAHNFLDPKQYDQGTLDTEVSKIKGGALADWVKTAATNERDPDALTHATEIYHRYENDIDPASRLKISTELNAKNFNRSVNNLANYFVNGTVAGLPGGFVAGIKQMEDFRETPYWDVKQWSVGYGTRASGPDEKPSRFDLETRFEDALTKSANFVDERFPNLDPGTRAALTSLTYNTGEKWADQDLGHAVAAGDLMRAKQLIVGYNHAGGQVSAALTNRRLTEAQWIGQDQPQNVTRQDAAAILDRVRSDPAFANRPELQAAVEKSIMAKAAAEQRADAMQQKAQKEASDASELQTFFAIHTNKPVTLDSIQNDPNMTTQAKERMADQLMKLQGTEDREEKSYGSGFYDLYKRIHLPDGDPQKITDASQLYGHVGPDGDLSVKGVDKLVAEIQGRRTLEGEAESSMKKTFLDIAKSHIAPSNPMGMKMPRSEEDFQRFLGWFYPAYEKARAGSPGNPPKTAEQLLTPGTAEKANPDYMGGTHFDDFSGPLARQYYDYITQQQQIDFGNAPGAPAAKFDINQVKSLPELMKAFNDNKVTAGAAQAYALQQGWVQKKPQPATGVPQSQ